MITPPASPISPRRCHGLPLDRAPPIDRRLADHRISPDAGRLTDFCAERGIVSDVRDHPIRDIDKAYDRMLRATCAIASSSI
jgi:hypothetical protein